MAYNNKTALIKWIAILTMTIDHIGYYLFPSLLFLRVVGRIAFPCFLYTTVQGVRETRDFRKYLLRLVLTGLISMPITAQTGNVFNILFTLALFALSIKDYRFILPAIFLVQFTGIRFVWLFDGVDNLCAFGKTCRSGNCFVFIGECYAIPLVAGTRCSVAHSHASAG